MWGMPMGAKLLAAIEALKKTPWVVLALLLASAIGALAQFSGATKTLVELVRPHATDPRAELARLGIPFTPAAMMNAVDDGDARAVGLLLDAGMSAEASPDQTQSPLMLAAKSGRLDLARRLRDAGANPAKFVDGASLYDPGGTPLDHAARQHHSDVVRLLLERPLPGPAIASALSAAADSGDVASVKLLVPHLVDRRAAVTAAIHSLVAGSGMNSRGPALATLAALGSDLDTIDANGLGLLHIAVNNDATTVLSGLLKAGANPDARAFCAHESNPFMATPLICAATRGTSAGLAGVQALIAAHADVDAREPGGATALMLAAGNGDPDITAALLKAGADATLRDAKGRTALDYVRTARFHDPEATRALLTRAAAPHRS